MSVWGLVLAVHLLCVMAWVGGMFYALVVLRPSLAVLDPSARLALHGRAFRRFFLVVWHAMPLAILSGYAMLFGVYGGYRGVDWTVQAMNGLGLLMAAVFVGLVFGPWRAFRRQPGPAPVERIRRLISVNLVLGIVTITIAALGHFGG